MDLHSSYFWFTVAESHGEEVPVDARRNCCALAWQISDLLRATDDADFVDQILDVTLSSRFGTASERYAEMGRVLDLMGQRVNPRYSKKIREIGDANLQTSVSSRSSNAPGAFDIRCIPPAGTGRPEESGLEGAGAAE